MARETVVPWRQSPRELLGHLVDNIECVQLGEWKVTATDAVYRDVMVGGLYMEGYRIGAIEHLEGQTFTFEVIENYTTEDEDRYVDGGKSDE